MMRQPRIAAAAALAEPLHVLITWVDGTSSTIDLTQLVTDLEAFAPLENPEFFKRLHVDDWGWSIEWNDEVELGADTLWRLALEQSGEAMPAPEFKAWRERNGLTLSQAARELGLSRRIVIYYEQGRKIIPKTVLLATNGYEAAKSAVLRVPDTIWRRISAEATTSHISIGQWVIRALESHLRVSHAAQRTMTSLKTGEPQFLGSTRIGVPSAMASGAALVVGTADYVFGDFIVEAKSGLIRTGRAEAIRGKYESSVGRAQLPAVEIPEESRVLS